MGRTESDNNETEDFFDTLAGRANSHPAAQALRAALQSETRTVKAAENATLDDLTDDVRAQLATIKNELISKGVFRSDAPLTNGHTANTATPAGKASVSLILKRIHGTLATIFGHSWQRPLAIAASVAIVSVLVLRVDMNNDADIDALRGGDQPTIFVPDPSTKARYMETALNEAGADAIAVQINENEWDVSVELSDESNKAAVHDILSEAGFPLNNTPPYQLQLIIKRSK